MNDCLADYQPLTLADQDLVNQYLALVDYRLSRYNFINLWMYSNWIPLYFCVKEDIMMCLSHYHDHYFSYMPLCEKAKLPRAFELIEEMYHVCDLPFIYACFEDDIADMILKRHPEFEKKAYRDSFDYIYKKERFVNFSGKKLQKKRNHLNAFYQLYPDFSYQEINDLNLPAIINFTKSWYKDRQAVFLSHDEKGNMEVLRNFKELKAQGACLMINNKIIAFIIATWQGKDTVQINIEKADEAYRGSYQVILREFLLRNFKDATYMNREDDLGLENLRKAKQSYHPDVLLGNYRICEKDHHVDYES